MCLRNGGRIDSAPGNAEPVMRCRAVTVTRGHKRRAHPTGLIEEQLATKRDLKELEEHLTYRLTLRLGSMMVAAIGFVAALVKLL